MTHAEQFLADVEAFLTRSGMKATAFGTAAVSDPSFVPDLRNGRKPNLGLVDKVHAFIAAYDAPPSAPADEAEPASEQQHQQADS
jgi:hypothetical protein